MTINRDMLLYLEKQMEAQNDAEGKLMYLLCDTYFGKQEQGAILKRFHELVKLNRYIRHVLQEAHDCEHCKENNLIVTLEDSDYLFDDDFLPEPE